MEITIIHGQNHKGSTYHVTELVKEALTGCEDIIHEYYLPKDGPDFCVGCYQCIRAGEKLCPQSKKVQRIATSIKDSDLLLIDSPTYCCEMSGQLKTLFDHMAYLWLSHRPGEEMFGKIGVAISTTAGAGANNVTKSIARQMFWWGVAGRYRLSVTVSAASWEDVSDKTKTQIRKKVNKITRKIRDQKFPAVPRLKTRLLFHLMKAMQKGNTWNPVDREYWSTKQWLQGEKPW